jgi:anti-sigma-K factor RskA
MDYARPQLADALAAQYVAGTLRGPARRRFEALLPSHPALQRAVRDWQDRLLPLTAAIEPVAPPPELWQRIEGRLWPAEAAAKAASAPSPGRPSYGWAAWQRLAWWRGLTGLATVAALTLAVLLANPAPPLAPVVVVLQATGAEAGVTGNVVASFSGDGRAVSAVPLSPVAVPPDRVLQLWWATVDGPPQSLGLIKPDGATVLPKDLLPGGIQGSQLDHLGVSIEPPGGSPTGRPTGPVVFYGKL